MAQDINFVNRSKYSMHIRKFFLFPEFWQDPKKSFNIPKPGWQSVKFEKNNKLSVPKEKGVYAFVVKPEYPSLFETRYLFYIGKTSRTLRERFTEYFYERDGGGKYRYFVREMLRQYDGHIHFYFLKITNKNKVDNCENLLLNTFVPFVNTDIPEAKLNPDLKNIYKSN